MIYFDNAASSPLLPSVKAVWREEMELWANPSSLHRLGFEAEKRLKLSRTHVAAALGVLPEEIVFTSGGTEADNLAIFGAARKMRRLGNKILTTDSEHPAVEECMKRLEEEGFSVKRLRTVGGALDLDEVQAEADEKTVLAALMHTNNETGAVYDIAAASRIIKGKNPRCLLFSDGVQGFLKGPVNPRALGVDLLSISSHKVHGPKGVGALYVKKGLQLPPLLCGGGQERGVRNGTENLPGIVSFGEACRVGALERDRWVERMSRIRRIIIEGLSGFEGIRVNEPDTPSCHIVSLQVPGWRSEVLLHTLSQKELFVSSGSACSSHKGKSPVLQNFGLNQKESDCTVRLSFSALNTEEEAVEAVRIIKEAVKK